MNCISGSKKVGTTLTPPTLHHKLEQHTLNPKESILPYANCGIIVPSYPSNPINVTPRLLRPLNLLHNLRLKILRLLGAGPTPLHLAVLANQELLKVPLDALQAHQAGLLVLEPFEGRVGFVAVDLSTVSLNLWSANLTV